MRRCGRLSEVPALFKNAEKANPHAEMEAGYHFCKGVFARHNCAPNEALKELNQVGNHKPEFEPS
jgi:tetratricopeptide repeat protein 21B